MIRVVLDTNIIVSAYLNQDGLPFFIMNSSQNGNGPKIRPTQVPAAGGRGGQGMAGSVRRGRRRGRCGCGVWGSATRWPFDVFEKWLALLRNRRCDAQRGRPPVHFERASCSASEKIRPNDQSRNGCERRPCWSITNCLGIPPSAVNSLMESRSFTITGNE